MKGHRRRIDSGYHRHGGDGYEAYSATVDVTLGLQCETCHRESGEIGTVIGKFLLDS